MHDVLDLREGASGEPDERCFRVGLVHGRRHLRLGRTWAQRAVDGLEDPAIQRHQVRHEGHAVAEFLLNFRAVSVSKDAVGGDAPVVFGEVRAIARGLAGT